MSPLFFQTEDELRQATRHLARPDDRKTRKPTVRRHNRWPVTCEFTLLGEAEAPLSDDDDDPVCLTSVDMSPTGVFLNAPDHVFEPGQGLLMEFVSPASNRPVRVWGRVARVVVPGTRQGRRPGVGIEFFDINEAQRNELTLLTHTASSAYAH